MAMGRYIPWPCDNPGPWAGVWPESVGVRDCSGYSSLTDPDFFCLHLVVKGSARFQTALGVDVVVRPGDLCCIWPHVAWRLFAEPPCRGVEVEMDWVRLRGPLAGDFLHLAGITEDRPWGHAAEPQKARAILRRLRVLATEYPPKADVTAVSLLYRLAGRCAEHRPVPPAERSPAHRIREAMAQQLYSGMNVSDFAGAFRISRSNLVLMFRKAFGRSPMEVLTELRIRHAEELLRTTDLSVAEVASAAGYADPLYFSRRFRKQTGTAPREYRRKVRAVARADGDSRTVKKRRSETPGVNGERR